jgi:hypothetical protein
LDLLGQNVQAHHASPAERRLDLIADVRQRGENLGIGFVLVPQATHETAAQAGYFRRVEGQVLVFGHLDGNRLKIAKERRATEKPTAWADAAQHLRFIPYADLPQLDARAKDGGQVLDQLAKVDASFRGKVKISLLRSKVYSASTSFIGSPCSAIFSLHIAYARLASSRFRSIWAASCSSAMRITFFSGRTTSCSSTCRRPTATHPYSIPRAVSTSTGSPDCTGSPPGSK